ncbi:hypothetical protein M885DRAFT_610191 [Pelagophyceae sp. CCMP2097]|nr:hypothetical protein M885DRAFT_610191 [Pelagophyceae sp. CCMP2097]
MGFSYVNPHDEQRRLLDELMGQERDLDLAARAKSRFWEADVEKFYLLGCSPYALLRPTKGFPTGVDAWVRHAYASALDLPETHDPAALKSDCELKAQYDALPAQEKEKFGYERALRNCIDSLVRQSERRILANQAKVAAPAAPALDDATLRRIADLDAQYAAKVAEAERLGESGDIDESMRAAAEAERLQTTKRHVETLTSSQAATGTAFVVCTVTGDVIEAAAAANDDWMQSHLESADFQGWKTLREWLAKLNAMRDGKGPPRGIPGYRGEGVPAAPVARSARRASPDRSPPRARRAASPDRRRASPDRSYRPRARADDDRPRARAEDRSRRSPERSRRSPEARGRRRSPSPQDRYSSGYDRDHDRRRRRSRSRSRSRDRRHRRDDKKKRERSPSKKPRERSPGEAD